MGAFISGLFSLIGGGVSSFFGYKQSQIESVNKVVDIVNQANISGATRDQAISAAIAAETQNGYWLSAVWRPLFMLCLTMIVLAYCFGYTTPNLLSTMPENSMINQLFELLKIGVMGYMPLRTIDKIVDSIARSRNLSIIIGNLIKKV